MPGHCVEASLDLFVAQVFCLAPFVTLFSAVISSIYKIRFVNSFKHYERKMSTHIESILDNIHSG